MRSIQTHRQRSGNQGTSRLLLRSNRPAPVIGLWPRVQSAPVAHFCGVSSASLEGAPRTGPVCCSSHQLKWDDGPNQHVRLLNLWTDVRKPLSQRHALKFQWICCYLTVVFMHYFHIWALVIPVCGCWRAAETGCENKIKFGGKESYLETGFPSRWIILIYIKYYIRHYIKTFVKMIFL